MTDMPRHPEMGPPVDAPVAQPPAPDFSQDFLPACTEASSGNDMTRPGGMSAVPELAEIDISGINDDGSHPDMTRPAETAHADSGAVRPGDIPEHDGGEPPDQPPPPTDITTNGEFPSDESVLDMPEAEREEFSTQLERFASGGERYNDTINVADENGGHQRVERGYRRTVPRQLLDAHGVGFEQVEVATIDQSDSDPYMVGAVASRVVDVEMRPLGEEVDPTVSYGVEGEETKRVVFSAEALDPSLAPVWTMEADSFLAAPRSGTIEISEDGSPVEIPITIDETGPAMTLQEARALARAVAEANSLPPDAPEFTEEYTPPYKPPYPDLAPSGEFPGEGTAFTDLAQGQRKQMINDIDEYARQAGAAEPREDLGVRRFERPIPPEILQRHGIEGEVSVVAQEGISHNYRRYGLRTSESVSTTIPGHEAEGELPGKKDAFLALFEVGGVRDGTHGLHGSTDESAGYRDVHVEYGGQKFYWRPDETDPNLYNIYHSEGIDDLTLDEVKRLHDALRDALRAAR